MLSHISFMTLPVLDPDRALEFYVDRFGMTVTVDAPFGDQRWIMLAIAGAATQLRLEPVAEMPDSPGPTLPLIAPDVALAVETLRDANVEIVCAPGPAEWNASATYALIRDSEGNTVLLASE